ncbi:MAG: hypothetical protein JWN80_1864 [Microbacteriaceae bacterium]|jgi:hypothetical protein|nr:hypothetical protein [Microbacteriaceae bacterium]
MRAVLGWLERHLVTADAVYGVILYAALVGVISDKSHPSLEVLVLSVLSLLVFWGAHVYAGTIANHGVRDGRVITIGAAFHDAVLHTSGMLYAAILPSIPLAIAIFGVLKDDDAASISMLVVVVQLAIIGYDSFAQRKSPIIIRILGAIGTGLFGFVMVILNLLVH